MMDFGIVAAELSGASGIAAYLIAGFRRAFPVAPSWAFVLASGVAGQAASFLLMFMQGHPLVPQHIAYHIVLGLMASGGEQAINRAHVSAETAKNGDGLLGKRHGTNV